MVVFISILLLAHCEVFKAIHPLLSLYLCLHFFTFQELWFLVYGC